MNNNFQNNSIRLLFALTVTMVKKKTEFPSNIQHADNFVINMGF